MYEQYSERGADFAQGPCDWHEGESCDMAGPDEAGGEHMTCVTAGIPCVDSSTMNQHACGDGGRTFLCTSTFIAERKMFKEDWMWLECTWRWNCGLLQEQLPNSYKVHRLHMRGSDIGDTYDRPRCGCLALNQERLVLTRDVSEYLLWSGAEPVFPVEGFWSCSLDDEKREIKAIAERRVTAVGDQIRWEDVLLPSQRDRKVKYEEIVDMKRRTAKLLDDEHVIFDLDQDPRNGHGRMKLLSVSQATCYMPTLIQHQVLWHSGFKRPLMAIEHVKIHGWLVQPDEIEHFGCAAAWRSDLIAGRISHQHVINMMGDFWHIPVQGRFFMWFLSIVEFRDISLPRSPSPVAHGTPVTPRRCKRCFDMPLVQCKRARISIDSQDGSTSELDESCPSSFYNVPCF